MIIVIHRPSDLSEAQILLMLKDEECCVVLKDGLDVDESNATACVELGLTVEDLQ